MKRTTEIIIAIILLLVLVLPGCGTDKTKQSTQQHTFIFVSADSEGNETSREISTTRQTVGDALLELGLISGEDGQYGLYIKEVNGIVADYEKDGTYWAFYINDEYAMSGVEKTAIEDGATYSFKIEK